MQYIIQVIITIIMTISMQSGAVNMVSSTPAEAAEDFLTALQSQDAKAMEKYMDNGYVNFICNAEGDKAALGKMEDAIFDNYSFEVEKVKQKNDVAVAKVVIKCNDFSNVMSEYDKVSYKYIMDNLYKEDIADKKKLNTKCLELYVGEIEKAAKDKEPVETTVFVPMVDNGYFGWNIVMSNELMKSVIGNLQMPVQE